MSHLSRRDFCSVAATVAAGALAAPQHILAQAGAVPVSLKIGAQSTIKIPVDFMGLSYESGQLAYPDFFSAENHRLIGIFRTLSSDGVLRLGGNLSEFTAWSDTDPSTAPERGGLVGPDPGYREPRTFTITPVAIRNLRAFLDATNWRCIYGLNLGGGTVEQALAEGSYVAKTLGPRLICVQFGNEPDLFKHHEQGDKRWTYEEYLTKWKAFRAAFHEKLPSIPVAGPDTAYNQEWFKRFSEDVPKDVVLLTSHYYVGGPPSDPKMTTEFLLQARERFQDSCVKALNSAKAAHVPFRMAEGNTCYNAGKPGVSDTFASALWAGDFCLSMASLGCVGVNLHGGANGYYSPIVGSIPGGFAVRPEFYGLLIAQHFSGYSLHAASVAAQGKNITAYAAGKDGVPTLAVVFNKDAQDAEVTVDYDGAPGVRSGRVILLRAPGIDSKTHVTLGDATVEGDGQFAPQAGQTLTDRAGRHTLKVPAHSAALIHLP